MCMNRFYLLNIFFFLFSFLLAQILSLFLFNAGNVPFCSVLVIQCSLYCYAVQCSVLVIQCSLYCYAVQCSVLVIQCSIYCYTVRCFIFFLQKLAAFWANANGSIPDDLSSLMMLSQFFIWTFLLIFLAGATLINQKAPNLNNKQKESCYQGN